MNELETTKKWFEIAISEPTDKQKVIQLGCHIEEIGEMLEAIELDDHLYINDTASALKSAYECDVEHVMLLDDSARTALLDSLADQIVTAIGVAHMMGFDILGALQEVNRSNFSKFEDGKAVFDENGKIKKGKDYTPPNLESFV